MAAAAVARALAPADPERNHETVRRAGTRDAPAARVDGGRRDRARGTRPPAPSRRRGASDAGAPRHRARRTPGPDRRRPRDRSDACRHGERPFGPGPRLSRPFPPGRGASRGGRRSARRRRHPRAARHHRHVPGRRGVRPAGRGHVRPGGGRRRRERRSTRAARCASASPTARRGTTNPVLAVVATLLELADARVGASAVVDLAGQAPVRRRFGFDDEDARPHPGVGGGVGGAVGRGRGAARALRDRVRVAQGTWATALDRLLLGVAMAEEDAALRRHRPARSTTWARATWTSSGGSRSSSTGSPRSSHELDGARPSTRAGSPRSTVPLDLLTDVAPADRWQIRPGGCPGHRRGADRDERDAAPRRRPSRCSTPRLRGPADPRRTSAPGR